MRNETSRPKQWVPRWHRRIALFACLWLVVLAISGVLINHAHDFGIDRSAVPPVIESAVYGIESGDAEYCYAEPAIGPECRAIFMRLKVPAGSMLISPGSVFLMDDQNRLVESLSASVMGLVRIEAVLRQNANIFLRDPATTVRTDTDLLQWEILNTAAAEVLDGRAWQVGDKAPEAITWERLLLDLHAARFLGPGAKWFTDLMAVLLLLLAVSGVWLWSLKRKGRNGTNSVR